MNRVAVNPSTNEEAAAGMEPTAAWVMASMPADQRRDISSARPCSYAASREARSASS